MSDSPHDPQLNALEATLSALQPAASIQRDRLLFEAGRRSVRPSRLWPAATALSTVTAAVLSVCLLLQPEPRTIFVQVSVATPPAPPPENVARHETTTPEKPIRVTQSWFRIPFLSDWPIYPERRFDDLLTMQPPRPKNWPGDAPPTTPLHEQLGIPLKEWKQIHFLGKPQDPLHGGY